MSLLSSVSGQSWPSVTGAGGVAGNRSPWEGEVAPSFCSSVARPSRDGRRDSFSFLGTQGSPSWRLGRRPLVPSAGEMVTCCFLSDPRTRGVGRGTYYSRFCPSVCSSLHPPICLPGPLALSLHFSTHLLTRPMTTLPSCLSTHHLFTSVHPTTRGPSVLLYSTYSVCMLRASPASYREVGHGPWTQGSCSLKASLLESPACMSLLIPLGRERRPAA